MKNTSNNIPHSLHLIRGESEGGHGSADSFIIASVRDGRFIIASVTDKIVGGRVADQT